MKTYIGIDLGGTNIKGALVNEQGEIIRQSACPTHAEQGVETVTATIADMIRDLAKGEDIAGVGLGCPGTVDDKCGTVVYACNLGWINYDVRSALKKLTGFSVRLVNDANAAALAEVVAGAAKGAESAVVVTLGTGVGGGVVIG
ncbi:MAG: ROK family protein, partial [Oscillospiraceae bacterium]|nr:ROK family protein [Oscillospiraceae bacterium]